MLQFSAIAQTPGQVVQKYFLDFMFGHPVRLSSKLKCVSSWYVSLQFLVSDMNADHAPQMKERTGG